MHTPDGEQIWGDALEEYENDVSGPYLCYDTLSLAVEDAFVGPPKREFSSGYDPHRFDHTKSDDEFPSDYEAKPNYDGPGYDVSDSDAEQLAIFYSSMWSAPQTSLETTPRTHSFADTGIVTEDSDMESRGSIPESSESDSPYESEYSTEDTDSDGSEDPGYTFHSSKTLASAPRSFGEQYSRDCGLGAVSSMIRSGASFLGLTARG